MGPRTRRQLRAISRVGWVVGLVCEDQGDSTAGDRLTAIPVVGGCAEAVPGARASTNARQRAVRRAAASGHCRAPRPRRRTADRGRRSPGPGRVHAGRRRAAQAAGDMRSCRSPAPQAGPVPRAEQGRPAVTDFVSDDLWNGSVGRRTRGPMRGFRPQLGARPIASSLLWCRARTFPAAVVVRDTVPVDVQSTDPRTSGSMGDRRRPSTAVPEDDDRCRPGRALGGAGVPCGTACTTQPPVAGRPPQPFVGAESPASEAVVLASADGAVWLSSRDRRPRSRATAWLPRSRSVITADETARRSAAPLNR